MIERRSWAVTLLLFTVTASACTQSEPPNAAPSTTSTAQMDIEDVSGIDDTPYQTQTDACRTNETRHFDDHTVASLVRQVHQFPNDVSFHERSTGGGIVLEDLDGDRDLDLVLTDGRGVNGIFFNDGQGTFLKGANRGVAYPGDFTVGLSAADYDNDGDTDLLILNRGPDRLLRNDGGGRFEDVTEEAGLSASHASASASWGDLDGDGHLDLFIAVLVETFSLDPRGMVYDRPLLYRNLGDGRFQDVSAEAGLPDGSTFIGSMVDLDDDGDLDLFVTQEYGSVHLTNLLYRNDGPSDEGWVSLVDVTESAGVEVPRSAMGVALMDIDDNGLVDLYVTNLYGSKPSREVLLTNQGDLNFIDEADALGAYAMTTTPDLRHPRSVSWGTVAFDIENDGDDDLYIAYGHFIPTPDYNISPGAYPPFRDGQPNALLINADDASFIDAPDACIAESAQSHGVVAGDIDGDGCIDLIVSNQVSPARVFRNRCASEHQSIQLSFRGTSSNRDAVGTRVSVRSGSISQLKYVHGCSTSVHSCEPKRLHFGLGSSTMATVEVRWPNGQEETMELSAGFHELVEP